MQKKGQKKNLKKANEVMTDTISYRLKCAKTANGLSHFVMYGDAPKDKAVL